MRLSDKAAASRLGPRLREGASYALELVVIAAIYFALAKIGLILASIHASATPIWPPTGLALAAVLLRGYRVALAILLGAFAANATTDGTIATSAAVGVGNMLESLAGAWLGNRWCGGLGILPASGPPLGVFLFFFFPPPPRSPPCPPRPAISCLLPF